MQAYSMAFTAKAYMYQLIEQVSRKPDLATIALLLVIALISLKILNMLVQTVLFWLRLFKTVAFYVGIAALGLWLWTRGPEGVMNDVQYWWDVWTQEYGYWKEKERAAILARQNGGSFKQAKNVWF